MKTLQQQGRIAFLRGQRRFPPRLENPDDAYEWLRGYDDAKTEAIASRIRAEAAATTTIGQTHTGKMCLSLDEEKIG